MCVYYDRGLIFKDIEISKRRDPRIIDINFLRKQEKAYSVYCILVYWTVFEKIEAQCCTCKYAGTNTWTCQISSNEFFEQLERYENIAKNGCLDLRCCLPEILDQCTVVKGLNFIRF